LRPVYRTFDAAAAVIGNSLAMSQRVGRLRLELGGVVI
jgi:hypothetical protein